MSNALHYQLQKVLRNEPKVARSGAVEAIRSLLQARDDSQAETRELRAVVQAYDAVINSLPTEQKIAFAKLTPPEYLKAVVREALLVASRRELESRT